MSRKSVATVVAQPGHTGSGITHVVTPNSRLARQVTKTRFSYSATAGARADPPRVQPALRRLPVADRRHLPAHVPGRAADGPAQAAAGRPHHARARLGRDPLRSAQPPALRLLHGSWGHRITAVGPRS